MEAMEEGTMADAPRKLNAFSGSLMTSGSFTTVGGSGD